METFEAECPVDHELVQCLRQRMAALITMGSRRHEPHGGEVTWMETTS